MRILPVIDVQQGRVVLARGGNRAHYGPIDDALHDPADQARHLLECTGGDELYLADLDAIERRAPNRLVWRSLADAGIRAWIDAGIRSVEDADEIEADTIVAGLETLDGPEVLGGLVERFGPERVVFSIDLRSGQPIARAPDRWGPPDPVRLAKAAIERGCVRILRLDLARVGGGEGTGALPWLRSLRESVGDRVELSVGGGVSGLDELMALEEAGASAVLAASALRDGRLDRESLARWRPSRG